MQDSQGSGTPPPDRGRDWPSTSDGDSRASAEEAQPTGGQGEADAPTTPPVTGPPAATPGAVTPPTVSPGEVPPAPAQMPNPPGGSRMPAPPGAVTQTPESQPSYGQPGYPQTPAQPSFGQPSEPAQPSQPSFGQPSEPAQPGEPSFGPTGRSSYGGPGRPGPGQPSFGQPGKPGYGQPGHSQPGYSQPSYGESGYGQGGNQPAGALPPPIWQAQPSGPDQPTDPGRSAEPGQPGGQAPWTTPLPAEQGSWTLPPGGGQGGWGPPPSGGGYGQPAGGYGQPAGPPPPRRVSGLGRVMIFVVVAVLAAALGAGVVLALQPGSSGDSAGTSSRQGGIPTPAGNGAGNNGGGGTNAATIDVHAVAKKVQPGMVDITSRLRYSGQVFEGTGMVLTSSGLVLTNNHVVNGSTSLQVTLVNSGRSYSAQVVGTDIADDVALLKLVNASGLKTIQVGNSDKVTLGTQVVALGNAGGTGGEPTVTSGNITALHRTITASDSGSQTSETLHNMLQTNAPIAEGDSGGPLANAAGQVIGMDTAANTRTLGGAGTDQGFAIPINRALSIARQMAAGHASGSIHLGQPPFLGIEIASASATASSTATDPHQQLQQLQKVATANGGGFNSSHGCMNSQIGHPVPSKVAPVSSGTLVAGVFCNAPARAAGMEGGDVITAVDGHQVTSPASLTNLMLSHYHPADTVSVAWVDTSGKHHTSAVNLAAGPAK